MEQFMYVLMAVMPTALNILYWIVVVTIIVHSFIAFVVIDHWGGVPRYLEWKVTFHQLCLIAMATVLMASFVWWNPQQVPLPIAVLLVPVGFWPLITVSRIYERLEDAHRRDLEARRTYTRFRP